MRATLVGIAALLFVGNAIALGIIRDTEQTSSMSRDSATGVTLSSEASPSPTGATSSASPSLLSGANGSHPGDAAPPLERPYCLSSDFKVSNSLNKTEYEFGEDVPLHMQVTYGGGEPCYIRIDEGYDRAFRISPNHGEGSWRDPSCINGSGRPPDTILWDPGQTRTWDFVWRQVVLESDETCDRFRQADPGEYLYFASYHTFNDPEYHPTIQSATIRFNIRPDPNASPSPSGPLPL